MTSVETNRMYRIGTIWTLALSIIVPCVCLSAQAPTLTDVLAASKPADWRPTDPQNTLYLELPAGRVVIELAPAFAPLHVDNIKRLVREHYYDTLSVMRVQDNYVAQWGDPDNRHPTPSSARTLPPEFDQPLRATVPFTQLADGDVYAPQVGFSDGFPSARDSKNAAMWLAHCYAMVGVGREADPKSGSGAELYVVIGHAPRHLDRNVALVGRVIKGIELLSSLPRGTAAMGFYENPAQGPKIRSVRLEADVAAAEREHLEIIRTDTPTFTALMESRRNRWDDWYAYRANRVELCNVPIAVRAAAAKPPH